MSCEQQRHSLIRAGMHLRSRQMVQCNGFPNRLWELVRIFTDRSRVDDGKMKTSLYKVRWIGYDRKGDTWEPITHLKGYASMVKALKESHEKDVQRLTADRRREAESKEAHTLANDPSLPNYFSLSLFVSLCPISQKSK